MDFQYKLIVSNQTFYKEFEIPAELERVKVGSTSNCEFRLNSELFFEDIEISLQKKEGWNILCSDNLYISRGDARKLLFSELSHDDVVNICYVNSGEFAFQVRFLIDFEAEIPRYDWYIKMAEVTHITISDTRGSDIELESEYGKGTAVYIEKTKNGIVITEKTSQLGVNVNGKKINKTAILKDFDFFSIADFFGFYKNDKVYFCHDNIQTNNIKKYNDRIATTEYPKFVRNTRIKIKNDETAIKILDPAAVPAKPDLNIITSLMPAIAMFALVVVLRGVLSTTGGTFVLFSICSMGLGVVTSVISIFDKKKQYKKDCAERTETYLTYIEKKKKEIEEAREKELEGLQQQYYSIEEDIEHISSFSAQLFDRLPEDEDFLDVYLGKGKTRAVRIIDYKLQEKLEAGDELSVMPARVAQEYADIAGAPIKVSLRNANAVGVVGKDDELYTMLKNMLIDLISRQYSGDLSIYMLLDEKKEKYDWIKLLPHLQSRTGARKIVCDVESKNNIFENLYKELTLRSETKEQSGYNVVFVMAENGIKNHPIAKFIEKASELNTVFVFFEPNVTLLPQHCSQIIEIKSDNVAEIYSSVNKIEKEEFIYPSVSDGQMRKAIELIAPVYCDEISLEGALRKSISLFELLGIYDVKDIDLISRWKQSKIYETMAVPLGVNVKNNVVYLNLHEKFHGPHGLVAGTTGSGKSEILQTYILGAATLFHPYEIGFVIIDFKGGGMVNQFKGLPHLMGAITNIDGKAIDRSLKSIKAELLKRQALFAEAEVNHIDKYIKAYKEGRVKTALPHLVIIVDEFAELKAEQPEFMKELISAARIGRSLGVHLILATQKPAGQVNDQIWSNSRFKLCLKVQTQEDSNEVLKSPLAAEIREPGRAYLQVGNNEIFELLQSGFSGSPEKSELGNQKSFDIYEVDFKGNRKLVYRQRPKKMTNARTQLEAIVTYVHDYCEKMHIEKLPEICLPDLNETIVFDNVKYGCGNNILDMQISIGIYDDPDHQCQNKAVINIGSVNTMIVGTSQYGKTNLLEVLIRGIAENYSPKDVNVYIIDFASMVLKNFEKLAHVGGVVCPSDDEKLKNLFKYLTDQINYRREILLSVGVGSFSSYKEAGYSDLPQLVLFIDNFTALKELYLQDNDMLMTICREGLSVGISVVLANSQSSGLGYKYMSNFATRMCLFCNETSEYSAMFGSCRIRPDEIPGRGLVEIDKTIYESQTFLAFEGEREIERIQNMQKFTDEMNCKYQGMHAKAIPEIPSLLKAEYVYDNFVEMYNEFKQILGISYDTVEPVVYEVQKNNMLAVSGVEESGKSNFIRYIAHFMKKTHTDIGLFVFDNYKKKLGAMQNDCLVYDVTGEQCVDTLVNLEIYLKNRYQQLISGDDTDDSWKMLIINNEDLFQTISADKVALNAFKNITGKYKMLNIFVVLGNVPNMQIVYGVPEIYKLVKESRNILFFGDLENCKIVDVPLSIVRKNKKKVETGDAFYVSGNECCKIKTPLSM